MKEYNKTKAVLKNCWVCPTGFHPSNFIDESDDGA